MTHRNWRSGKGIRLASAAGGILLTAWLAGCASTPPPDWKLNAHSGLESYAKLYLEGETRLADLHFGRARAEIARTARLDLDARAELYRCGIRAAALDFTPCQGFDTLRAYAAAEDLAYDAFLHGLWHELDHKSLPKAYIDLVAAKDQAARQSALAGIKDPVSRLIAAGVLLRAKQIDPAGMALATQTASDQGWRRPLLVWLRIQRDRAEAAADSSALTTLEQRIRLLERSLPAEK